MEAFLSLHFPVRVETRPGRGRCVVASRPIAAGETVMVCAPAATLALRPGACCFCAGPPAVQGGKLLRCSACKVMAYCGKACQAADWARDHKAECRAWPNLASLPDTGGVVSNALLLGRLFRGARLAAPLSSPSGDAGGASAGPAPYRHALSDVRGMETDERAGRGSGAFTVALEVARTNGLLPVTPAAVPHAGGGLASDAEALAVLGSFTRNNFAVTDERIGSLAAGVYPAGALLNHSCAPNTVLSYPNAWLPDGSGEAAWTAAAASAARGSYLQVARALVDVGEGDELTHTYVEPARPTAQRRAHLRATYGFDCSCTSCAMAPGDAASPGAFLERRADGGSLPSFLSSGEYADGPNGDGGSRFGAFPDDLSGEAAAAIKSARVLASLASDEPAKLTDALLGRVTAAYNAGGGGAEGEAPPPPIGRYSPSKGSVPAVPADDVPGACRETAALEAALALLARGGALPLHLDVQACAAGAFGRYLALNDVPAALVAGEHIADFYAGAYVGVPRHPMRALHLQLLGELYADLAGAASFYLRGAKRSAGARGQEGVAAPATPPLLPPERAAALRTMYRTPAALDAISIFAAPLDAAALAALRRRARACFTTAERTLTLAYGPWGECPRAARASLVTLGGEEEEEAGGAGTSSDGGVGRGRDGGAATVSA